MLSLARLASDEEELVCVEQWAKIRRTHFVERLSIKEIHRRTGRDRKTIRRAIHSAEPPRYRRAPRRRSLIPSATRSTACCACDARLPGKRIRELIEELGYEGGKTILDDYLRELRPRYLPRRTYQRTLYRPGELVQFDLFEPREPIPVGHGQARRASSLPLSCAGRGRSPGRWCSQSRRPICSGG